MKNDTMFRRQIENFMRIRRDPRLVLRASKDGTDISSEKEIFMCPLCLKIWPLEPGLAVATQEHVPPKQLGGKSRCVTCQDCNSEHGNSMDSDLIQRINLEATMSGQYPSIGYRVQVRTENGKLANVNFYQGEDPKWRLLYKDHSTKSRQHLEQIEDEIFRPHSKFNVSFRYPNDRKRDIGLLRIAYLEAFCALGYGFLFHKGTEGMSAVLSQLNHPGKIVFPIYFVSGKDNLPDESLGVNIVNDPLHLRSLFVVFDVDYRGYRERYGVFLPGLRSDWRTTFLVLNKAKEAKDDIRFGLVPYSQGNFSYQEDPWIAQEMWDRVFPED